MQPGQFILFNERTLHHSEANQSDLRRIGLAVRAIIPIVKVLEYDSPDHALQIIHGHRHDGPQSPRAAAGPIAYAPNQRRLSASRSAIGAAAAEHLSPIACTPAALVVYD